MSWCVIVCHCMQLSWMSGEKDGRVSRMLYVIICHYLPLYVHISHYMSLCHYMSYPWHYILLYSIIFHHMLLNSHLGLHWHWLCKQKMYLSLDRVKPAWEWLATSWFVSCWTLFGRFGLVQTCMSLSDIICPYMSLYTIICGTNTTKVSILCTKTANCGRVYPDLIKPELLATSPHNYFCELLNTFQVWPGAGECRLRQVQLDFLVQLSWHTLLNPKSRPNSKFSCWASLCPQILLQSADNSALVCPSGPISAGPIWSW